MITRTPSQKAKTWTWTLVLKNMGCEEFRFQCASGDAAKTRARQLRQDECNVTGNDDEGIGFDILDPAGQIWVQAQVRKCKRLKWEYA